MSWAGSSCRGDDLFVIKFDADGQESWRREFGDGAAEDYVPHGVPVAVDADDDIVIAASFREAIDLGNGLPLLQAAVATDTFVAKLDAAGNSLWAKHFGGAGDQIPMDLTITNDHDIVLAGFFNGVVDFGGGEFAQQTMVDGFVAVMDGGGGHLASRQFSGSTIQVVATVSSDPVGNLTLAGFFEDSGLLRGRAPNRAEMLKMVEPAGHAGRIEGTRPCVNRSPGRATLWWPLR